MRMRLPAYLVTYFAAALPARPRRKFEPVLTNLRPRRGGASQGGRWRQARALKKVETDTVSELRAYFVYHTARSPLYTIPSAVLIHIGFLPRLHSLLASEAANDELREQ